MVQDATTSVVWGMPGEVDRAGAADEVLPLREIGPAVVEALGLTAPGDPLGLRALGRDEERRAG